MEKYVLDSFPLLVYFQGEPGKDKVIEILRSESEIYLNWINLGEVFYIIARKRNLKIASEVLAFIKHLPIHLIQASPDVIIAAARIKAQYPMAYADSFVVATALSVNGTIITGDPEFKTVESKLKILWMGK